MRSNHHLVLTYLQRAAQIRFAAVDDFVGKMHCVAAVVVVAAAEIELVTLDAACEECFLVWNC